VNHMSKNVLYSISFCFLLLLSGCRSKQLKQPMPITDQAPQGVDLAAILRKSTKDMTFDEATYGKEYYQKEKDNEMMTRCAQRMLAVGGHAERHHEIMRKTTLELAQWFLAEGKFDKAQKYALDYQTIYPGTPEAKLAAYINIKAHFLSTLSFDRDQTETEKTLELAQAFLSKHKTDIEYSSSVQDMVDNCYRKLVDREIHVIDSHLGKYNYNKNIGPLIAAYNRLGYIKSKLLPHIKTEASRVAQLEIKLAQVSENVPQLAQARKQLAHQVKLAQATKNHA
jgi:outer membrane protein assembly factor BamD (BamD/ComL family)